MRAPVNGVELCLQAVGDPADPAVLLIMGAAGSMDRWEPGFCARLAAAGRHVIRYDHRDSGGSTCWPPGAPGYTGDDLVADAVGVLEHLGVARAHLVGLSMGGAIAQRIAVDHPGRVLSLTLMSTSPIGRRGPQHAPLPPMTDALRAVFSGGGPPEPDWSDRAAVVDYLLDAERPYTGPRGIDDAAARELLGHVYDRSPSPASATNHFMVDGTDVDRRQLTGIRVPTLVIHGTHDPLFPPAHGEALASEIPGARLLLVDDLGHELPRWAWDAVLPAIVEVTG